MTLIEVMVALGLASIVVAGGFALIASQRGTYVSQTAVGRRQQELWVGLEFIQRDLRKAGMGWGGCRITNGGITYRAHVDCNPNGAALVQTLRPVDFTDGGTTGTDTLTIRFATPPGSGAVDATLAAPYSTWSTSAISVNDARGFMSPIGCTCAGATPCTFPSPVYALLWNAGDVTKVCSVVQVTGANCLTNQLTIDPQPTLSCSTAPYAAPVTRTYPAGEHMENLGPLRVVTYSIDTTGDPTTPRLVRTVNDGTGTQTIAFGVEDLQIVPGCDVNGNGYIDLEGNDAATKASDEWFNNIAGDTVPGTCTTYPEVRVSLTVRTAQAAAGFTGTGRPALENRAAGATDNFQRRVVGTTVATPNLAL